MRILVASFLLLAACSSKQNGTIAITLGGEADALTRSPAPTSLVVDAVDRDGGVSTLATVNLPADRADLADLSSDRAGSVRITGKDFSGASRVWGASLAVTFGALVDTTLPVFVQRTGEMARMPDALTDAREAPIASVVAGRYVFLAGGSDSAQARSTGLYDLLWYKGLSTPPILPRSPRSVAVAGTKVLVLDDQGGSIFDLSDSSSADVQAPSGGTFAEVVGGASLVAPDGTAILVGAARADGPATSRVLLLTSAGSMAFVSLTFPRIGAATAYVPGRGLLVFGGNGSAPAIELLAPGATTAIAASFPARDVSGAAATALDGDRVLFAWAKGPVGTFLTLDLAHPDANAAAIDAALPCAARHVDLLALDANRALGIAEDGASCAFTWDGSGVMEVPLKLPRRGARGIRLPTGAIGVVGGSATIEEYAP